MKMAIFSFSSAHPLPVLHEVGVDLSEPQQRVAPALGVEKPVHHYVLGAELHHLNSVAKIVLKSYHIVSYNVISIIPYV